MKVAAFALTASLLAAGHALAASREVQYGPQPSWVAPPPAPTNAPSPEGAPLRFLYLDNQAHLGPNGLESYTAYRARVLKPEGLPIGNITAAWNPSTDDFTVHTLKIHRGDQVIDVLSQAKFKVIEREDNLAQAMLDGTLTAVLQTPGLQVGDELEFAGTIHRKDPVLGGKASGLNQLPVVGTPGAFRIRLAWPKSDAVSWRVSPDLGALKPVVQGQEWVLEAALDDPKSVVLTDQAPARYNLHRLVQFSQFQSWGELSHQLWTGFDQASTLPAGSPVKAEAQKIAAETTDPAARAEAALRLVQDRVRYVYVGFNNGAYRPAQADETWNRKFGDCKAKTVLLLALLKELAIQAEPVAVNSKGGDGADQRLPTPDVFDHVVVRATIAGKAYWLDGTRLGDRRLSALPAPVSRWALALRPGPADIEAIAPQAPFLPLKSDVLQVDATAGFDKPAKVTEEEVLRGDEARQVKAQLSALAADDAVRAVQAYFRQDAWLDPERAYWRFDEGQGALVLGMEGTGKVDWEGDDKTGRSLAIWGAGFTPPNELKRPKEQDQAAAWTTDFPKFNRWTTVIRLPRAQGKWRWAYASLPVNKDLGGVHYWREAELKDGVMRTTMSIRTYAPEITAAQAKALNEGLATFDNNMSQVYLTDASKAPQPKVSAQAMIGVADHTQQPEVAWTAGMVLTEQRRFEDAGRMFDKALALNPKFLLAQAGKAEVLRQKGDLDGALTLVDEDLKATPRNATLLELRASLYMQKKRYADAVSDLDEAIRQEPESRPNFINRGVVLHKLGRDDEALADLEEAWRMDPLDPRALEGRAEMLRAMGRKTEALAAMDEWIRADRTPVALNARCWARAIDNQDLAKAEADCAEAIKLKPDLAGLWDSYGLVALRQGKLAEALARYNKAIELEPKKAPTLFARGLVRQRSGDSAGAAADFAAAKALDPTAGAELARAGLAPAGTLKS